MELSPVSKACLCHGSRLHPAGTTVERRPGEVGALWVVHAGPATFTGLHPSIGEVIAREVAGESPIAVAPVDRGGRGDEEKSEKNDSLHRGWRLVP